MDNPQVWVYLAAAASVAGLAMAWGFSRQVNSADPGNDHLQEIMGSIRQGTMTFLRREYVAMAGFVVAMAGLIYALVDWARPWGVVGYLAGAVLSALAGYVGLRNSTAAAARTAEAARQGGIDQALPLAFRGGAVAGFTVAGLGLAALALGYRAFVDVLDLEEAFNVLTAIALGASSVALFARVGGGIYANAAEVGADLVGKTEPGIPVDDLRNPAAVADRVGDNVGGVAGMGADLFESYVGSLAAPMVFAAFAFADSAFREQAFFYPLLVATIGMAASIIGSFFVRPGVGSLASALNRGTWVAMGVTVVGVAALTPVMFNGIEDVDNGWGLFLAVVIGLGIGYLIGHVSDWFTSDHFRIVKEIARQAETGPATVTLTGIAQGMRAAAFSVVIVVVGMGGAYWGGQVAFDTDFSGIYGIAIAAIGVVATLGITVSVGAYGPIAASAGGIVEMAHLPPEVRQTTDALGTTTAVAAKGIAVASAAVTALALFFTFRQAVLAAGGGFETLGIFDVEVAMGLFLGAMVPFLFAALTITAVGRVANEMVEEVRRQFREIAGLREGRDHAHADHARCVDMSTTSVLRELFLPSLLVVALPLVVGFVSVDALGGFLAGSLISGFLFGILMTNAGGAWDNARGLIEAGAFGGKESEAHKAAVVGDTIGATFKDTAGPAMNSVIKMMTIVALVFASAFV